mmetsp:Transcript_45516/g.134745  ORF Transcript_45516/g.134745 Transcript_45516/m.134745 type:complete len:234 (+) Transcript_45516:133-834(+)
MLMMMALVVVALMLLVVLVLVVAFDLHGDRGDLVVPRAPVMPRPPSRHPRLQQPQTLTWHGAVPGSVANVQRGEALLQRVMPPKHRAHLERQALTLAGLAGGALQADFVAHLEAAVQADDGNGAVLPPVALVAEAHPAHADAVAVALAGARGHLAPGPHGSIGTLGVAAVRTQEVLAADARAVHAQAVARARVGALRRRGVERLDPARGHRVAVLAGALGRRVGCDEGAHAVA